jgi:hypothetical protein
MLGPRPAPPPLTGDPTQDVQANLLHVRALNEHIDKLTQQQTEIAKGAARIQADKAAKELALETAAQAAREKKQAADDARRQANQAAIDQSVQERAAAAKDLEGMKFDEPLTGSKLVAAILGGLGAAISNYGAAQAGRQGTAQNEALNTINALTQKDYERRKAKLAAASEAVLQARYGYKDAADNRRAADNDLDADFAAKHRLIIKEAEAQLRRSGADEATIAGNLIIANSAQKQAQAEGAIHEREEKMVVDREHARATEQLARASLGVQQGHLSLSRTAEADAHADRQAANAARAEGAKEKAAAATEDRTLRDPNTGDPLGMVPPGSRGLKDKNADMLAKSAMYVDAVDDLAKHIETYGHIVNPLSDQWQERKNKIANVQAMGRGVKGIQASDAGQALEHDIIGGNGLGLNRTAKPAHLRQLADEARTGVERHLRASLSPMPGEATSRPPASTAAPAPAAPKGPAPKLTGGDAEQMLDFHRKGDARFDAILKANGLI